MKRYSFLFAILFFIGCTSSPAESTKEEVEQTKNKTASIVSNSNEIAESKGLLLSDNLEKKKPTAAPAKEKTTKSDVSPKEEKTQIKRQVEKVTTTATAAKENVAIPSTPKPKPTSPIVEAPKVVEKKIEKVQEPDPEPVKVEEPKKVTSIAHTIFDGLLKKHVSSTGKVNYKGLKSAESTLDEYLGTLEKTIVKDLNGRNEKMAFWINAYNAYTIKLILKNYPLKSITDLHGGKPWDVKWIKLDDRTLSLNNIENDILRPKYKDPRIHFAVNCAAKSCPALLNKAWTPSNLESSFANQTKNFVNNTNFNKISKKKVELSKIFEWYGEDFGNLVNFLNKYTSTEINSNAKIEFVEYDWSLNE